MEARAALGLPLFVDGDAHGPGVAGRRDPSGLPRAVTRGRSLPCELAAG
jgi:hypothetical protein